MCHSFFGVPSEVRKEVPCDCPHFPDGEMKGKETGEEAVMWPRCWGRPDALRERESQHCGNPGQGASYADD